MKCSAVVFLPLGIVLGSVNFVPEKTEDILHCHHWFPGKMTSEKCRNSILMMCHHPGLE